MKRNQLLNLVRRLSNGQKDDNKKADTTAKTASMKETPAKSVAAAPVENAVKAETEKTENAKVTAVKEEEKITEKETPAKKQQGRLLPKLLHRRKLRQRELLRRKQRQIQKYMFSSGAERYIQKMLQKALKKYGQKKWAKKSLI